MGLLYAEIDLKNEDDLALKNNRQSFSHIKSKSYMPNCNKNVLPIPGINNTSDRQKTMLFPFVFDKKIIIYSVYMAFYKFNARRKHGY